MGFPVKNTIIKHIPIKKIWPLLFFLTNHAWHQLTQRCSQARGSSGRSSTRQFLGFQFKITKSFRYLKTEVTYQKRAILEVTFPLSRIHPAYIGEDSYFRYLKCLTTLRNSGNSSKCSHLAISWSSNVKWIWFLKVWFSNVHKRGLWILSTLVVPLPYKG